MRLICNVKIFLFIFLSVLILSGCSSDESRQMLNNADQEFKKGNYSGAKAIYNNIVSEHSYSDEATKAKEILGDYDAKIALNNKLRKEEYDRSRKEEEERQLASKNKPSLEYEIVHKITGDGYMTFFVCVDSDDDQFLINVSNDFKDKHARNLRLGFQVRFVKDRNARTNQEGFAVYAYTKHLNLSRLTKYDSNSEHIVLDDL